MTFGYLMRVAVTSLALLLSPAAASPARPQPHVPPHHKARRNAPSILDPDALFSRRALRRARLILELRLLELRRAKLDRVERAIENRVPIDRILEQDSPAPRTP